MTIELVKEEYNKGTEVINYVVYKSTTGNGNDEVLQHKLFGSSETAHITLHPDGTVNFRIKRTGKYLEEAIRNELAGYDDIISENVKRFISKVKDKI